MGSGALTPCPLGCENRLRHSHLLGVPMNAWMSWSRSGRSLSFFRKGRGRGEGFVGNAHPDEVGLLACIRPICAYQEPAIISKFRMNKAPEARLTEKPSPHPLPFGKGEGARPKCLQRHPDSVPAERARITSLRKSHGNRFSFPVVSVRHVVSHYEPNGRGGSDWGSY